jgi:hypothetical protein
MHFYVYNGEFFFYRGGSFSASGSDPPTAGSCLIVSTPSDTRGSGHCRGGSPGGVRDRSPAPLGFGGERAVDTPSKLLLGIRRRHCRSSALLIIPYRLVDLSCLDADPWTGRWSSDIDGLGPRSGARKNRPIGPFVARSGKLGILHLFGFDGRFPVESVPNSALTGKY